MTNRVQIGKLSNYPQLSAAEVFFDKDRVNHSNNTKVLEVDIATAANFTLTADVNFSQNLVSASEASRTASYNACVADMCDSYTINIQHSTTSVSSGFTTVSSQTFNAVYGQNAASGAGTFTNNNEYGVAIFSDDNSSLFGFFTKARVTSHNEVFSGHIRGNGTYESDAISSYTNTNALEAHSTDRYGRAVVSLNLSTGANYFRVELVNNDSGCASSVTSSTGFNSVGSRSRRISLAQSAGLPYITSDVQGSSGTHHGLRISKVNVDVENAKPNQVLFDSRFNRQGVIYGGGFQSSVALNNTTGIDFKGSKTQLAYTPLIWATEDKTGSIEVAEPFINAYSGTDNNGGDYAERMNMFITSKTHIIPCEMYHDQSSYSGTDSAVVAGRDNTKAQCTNLNFRVLKIPLGYGYMNSTYYGDGTSSSTNRVVVGKYTNSNAGYSSAARGIFVSKNGKNVLTCTDDELIFNTDQGGSTSLSRGHYQTMTVNLTAVQNNAAEPTSVAVVTGITTTNSPTISYSIPYTFTAPTGLTNVLPTLSTNRQSSTGNGSTSSSALTFSESISSGVSTITLSTSSTGSLTAQLAPVKFDSTFSIF